MVIIVQCSDAAGLVAGVSGTLTRHRLNIISLDEYVDKAEGRFYLRLNAEPTGQNAIDNTALQRELAQVLPPGAVININPEPQKKIVVLVTKEYHCLADILVRHYFGTLGAQVLCVIGNHITLQDICRRFDIPFLLISHEGYSKAAFEQRIADAILPYEADYIVLAKFMRILSPEFVARFPMQLINIHHSFLPAFVGASPYRQAYERGVKLIGATAHFVTDDLDEGPIIAQQTIPVNHNFTAADMVKAGKEIETAVLAKALQLVFDDRVFVYKNKTIVFE
ncbi:formyltetrahydrofolate deformylase [Mucilaginibacter sp. Bleaf8]|uniref:formyltetrahydrofolate deformylase n=1 Tax=Mucilaginibacter sp. Bleaf8 TaxID=2834430 RepID=UPI001BCDA2B2|nr:formyltetrahydrofolate deformylase [Mucilaginibacter sp. Bleaf8]MBS7566289.1 formyltetrahydrofolate deformylase [Mucilaginibacter sp. Bleaf8]